MNDINQLLAAYGTTDLKPEEDATLTRELADAYHMDERSCTSRDVQRLIEMVRSRMVESNDKG